MKGAQKVGVEPEGIPVRGCMKFSYLSFVTWGYNHDNRHSLNELPVPQAIKSDPICKLENISFP